MTPPLTQARNQGHSHAVDNDPVAGELRIQGIPVSSGVALARVCLFNEDRHAGVEEYTIAAGDIAGELTRLQTALERARDRLAETARKVSQKIGPAEAEIFTVQRMIMEDESALTKVRSLIETRRINAESAVMTIFSEYENRFFELSSDYLRERAGDIAEARQRLLDALTDLRPALVCDGFRHCRRGRDRIIVARELSPALTVELDTGRVRGFVTERGGATSHAAILARALGVPSVSGVTGILNRVTCGARILVNGDTGQVVLSPGPDTLSHIPELRRGRKAQPVIETPLSGFTVMANINLASAVRDAKRFQADGIGLYRTEFEHIVAGRLLTENEQSRRYIAVLKAMAGQPVFFRLLDMGGDKGGEILGLSGEENPSLGLRGSRLLLRRPDLLDPHVRALARAAETASFSILYPMIVDIDQFLALRARMNAALAERKAHPIRHGIMFEVPSACLQAEVLLEHADFGSIGTNDLAQYLFAADRDNEYVVDDLNFDRPVFWKLIGDLVAAAARAGKPISVCGELAADPQQIRRLHDLGIRSVSVSSQNIAGIRRTLKDHLNSSPPPEIQTP